MSESLMIAIVAAGGVAVGAVISSIGQIAVVAYKDWRAHRDDEVRRQLLRQMLDDPAHDWRSLDQLRHVIGCDAGTARQLLLEVGARASESGTDVWGYVSRHPLGGTRPKVSS